MNSGTGSHCGASEEGHLAALASLDRVGPARLRWLVSLGSCSQVWDQIVSGRLPDSARGGAGVPDAARSARLDTGLMERWRREARARRDLPAVMDRRMEELSVDVLRADALPGVLLAEPDPPAALFCTGSQAREATATVAIVGTRRASSYGLRIAHQLGRELSGQGVTVVSGLALGIDGSAHSGALEGPSPALAVIGAGHDRPCPQRNRGLAARISENGLVVGEVPPGAGSAPWRFPVRNRLIAAFAQVVVVVESAMSGGSMSTVAEALARGRSVMAVPGPVGRTSSEGCHELLRDGAHVCTGAEDVLALLDMESSVAVSERDERTARRGASVAASGAGFGNRRRVHPPERTGLVARVRDAEPVRTGDRRGAREEEAEGVQHGDDLASRIVQELMAAPLTLDSVTLRCGAALEEVATALAGLEADGTVRVSGGWLELAG